MEIIYAAGGALGAILLFIVRHYVTRGSIKRDEKEHKRDVREALHATNEGKQIDADQAAFTLISDRLKLVEARVDKLQQELGDQREMNARKDQQIAHLEHENERYRDRCIAQDKEIAALRSELEALKLVVLNNASIKTVADMEQPIDVRLVSNPPNE